MGSITLKVVIKHKNINFSKEFYQIGKLYWIGFGYLNTLDDKRKNQFKFSLIKELNIYLNVNY